MKNLAGSIYDCLYSNMDCALLTVIDGSGSAPRGAGAHMAVFENGNAIGTVGGGAVEWRLQKMAAEVLKNKTSEIKQFKLNEEDITNLGMICGGDILVYLQFISHRDENALRLFAGLSQRAKEDEDLWCVTEIEDSGAWKMYTADKKSIGEGEGLPFDIKEFLLPSGVLKDAGGKKIYIEPFTKKGMVYIFGGGHISQRLVPVLSYVGFKTAVFDDMEMFAKQENFKNARVIKGNFEEIGSFVDIKESDCVVIVTRGHKNDYSVLRQVLKTRAYYIGMIGSRSKIEKTRQRLAEDGFFQEDFKRVNSPIGLSIKAETPEEIAISIAAEMILKRAERK